MTGGWRSGRERKLHACPAGADAAVAGAWDRIAAQGAAERDPRGGAGGL